MLFVRGILPFVDRDARKGDGPELLLRLFFDTHACRSDEYFYPYAHAYQGPHPWAQLHPVPWLARPQTRFVFDALCSLYPPVPAAPDAALALVAVHGKFEGQGEEAVVEA